MSLSDSFQIISGNFAGKLLALYKNIFCKFEVLKNLDKKCILILDGQGHFKIKFKFNGSQFSPFSDTNPNLNTIFYEKQIIHSIALYALIIFNKYFI